MLNRISRTLSPKRVSLHQQIGSSGFAAVLALASAVASGLAQAVSFGTYDARGLAMAGTAVASATPQQAIFYNPALLSFHDARAEESRSGRLYLPMLTAQTSRAGVELMDVIEDDLDVRLDNAITAFNANPSMETAAQARQPVADLLRSIDLMAGEPLTAEAFAGLAISEPDLHSGGAFYLGARVVAGARAEVRDADLARLHRYLETFDQLTDNPDAPTPYPELYGENGQLRHPADTLESTVSGRGAAILEWGLGVAREFEVRGYAIALGVTPKFMQVRAYEEIDWVIDGNADHLDNGRSHLTGNLDLGVATRMGGIRFGVAVKDVIEQSFSTWNSNEVKLRPRARAGVAWVSERFVLSMDADLLENEPIGFEEPVQDLAFGAELEVVEGINLRLGYSRNLKASSNAAALTTGLGFQLKRVLLDVAYSGYDGNRGGSMQLGYAF